MKPPSAQALSAFSPAQRRLAGSTGARPARRLSLHWPRPAAHVRRPPDGRRRSGPRKDPLKIFHPSHASKPARRFSLDNRTTPPDDTARRRLPVPLPSTTPNNLPHRNHGQRKNLAQERHGDSGGVNWQLTRPTSQGARAAQKRERNAKDAKGVAKSQLKVVCSAFCTCCCPRDPNTR
jgi:hypothetical protein